MVTLTQYGFMTPSAYKPGDDVTPDFSQAPGELIAEAVSALSEIIGDSADDYVARACSDYGLEVERDGAERCAAMPEVVDRMRDPAYGRACARNEPAALPAVTRPSCAEVQRFW